MFILQLVRGVPSKNDTQWGSFEKDQAEAFANAGHKVVSICVDTRLRLLHRKIGIRKKIYADLPYYVSFICPGLITNFFGKKVTQKLIYFQFNKLFKLVIKDYGIPDIVYCHYYFNGYWGAKLKQKYRFRLVTIEHASILNNDKLNDDVFAAASYAYSYSDRIIAVSESLAKRIKEHFDKDSIVVHNMVGSEFWLEPFTYEIPSGEFKLLAVGSLIRRKGFDVLIKACANLNVDNWSLQIIGDGPELQSLKELAQVEHIASKISFLGKKSKIEIAGIMRQSHIFISSSRLETFSVVCAEAIASGMPVISTICGGPEEFIDDSNGILIPIDNVEMLSSAIINIMYDYSNYSRLEIRNNCKKKFFPMSIMNQILSVFNSINK